MNGHLVSVEVGVVRRTNQRMELDGFALYQDRFEGLDTKPVERRSTVEEHRVILDDVIEYIPDLRADLFYHSLCALDVVSLSVLYKFLHDEGLEEFESHLLRKSALIELEFRSYYDYGTS